MNIKEKKTFLHTLERKLNSFRKRVPLYCQCLVLFDEDMICITAPGNLDTTMKIHVDFSKDVSDYVGDVHDKLMEFFPVLERNGKEFFIDKVDFHSNSFVVKYKGCPSDWSSIYKMKRPVSLLLKETFQNRAFTPTEKERVFDQNIREVCSEEDYRNVF